MRYWLEVALLWALTLVGPGWSVAVPAQTPVARVGVLVTPLAGTDEAMAQYYEPFRRMLAQQGWIEGKNLSLEYRRARGSPPRYEEPAAELASLRVDVIYASSAPATRAAYAATQIVPIIARDYTNDPVAVGYAESYGHPGRNLTGVFLDAPEFVGKWLQQLKAIVPGLSRVAVLWDPTPVRTHLSAIQEAAKAFAIQTQVLEVRKLDDIDSAFAALRPQTQALIILPSPMTWAQSPRLAKLAKERRLPAASMPDLFAESGGMLSYGPDFVSDNERCAMLVARVLRGVKVGDLPIERPAKFQLIINSRRLEHLA